MADHIVSVGPETATRMFDLETLTIDGVTFRKGDRVCAVHKPSGSRLYGTLGEFYGIHRVRGIRIETYMVGTFHFPFADETDREIYELKHAAVPAQGPTHEGGIPRDSNPLTHPGEGNVWEAAAWTRGTSEETR